MDVYRPTGYVGGRFRANWQVTFNEPANSSLDVIDPGGGSTVEAGAVQISQFDDGVAAIWIINNLVYAIPLENGHSHIQAPQGMVKITAAEFQQYVTTAI